MGASGEERTDATWGGISILFEGGADPSARNDIWGNDCLRFRRRVAGPMEEACSPITEREVCLWKVLVDGGANPFVGRRTKLKIVRVEISCFVMMP